ncbi:DUF2155 domain-containing protein [Aliihoeflea sp. 40Bstr573]|uniref:DUF2155 domain-containing protein n=1 Tax=Aliihoeflea sp. 40Bstr573 TaxID=2696467 RepID=UPI002094741D|nr:DUF2155 domain-containing protein [Aliihoeflea sp. 40Bstr573]
MNSRLAGAFAGLVFATGLAVPGSSFAQDLQFDLPQDDEFIYEEAPNEGGSFEDLPMEEAPTEVPIQRVKNPVAEFSGIDKITGRIISFDVYVDETVQFGALQVTPRVCYSSAEGQEPRTDGFVEVDEITLDRKIRRIFSGWMFAESPGLNAVEHAVYDVWLKACKQESEVPAPESAAG